MKPLPLPLPRNLIDAAKCDGRERWISRLSSIVALIEDGWLLKVGEPYQPGGRTAWVAPAEGSEYGGVVLKIAWRHFEGEQEADGLRQWNGAGAVRLHRVAELDDETTVLLLERCVPGTTLTELPELEQDQVIARLLAQLWRPPPAGTFRPLKAMCDAWAGECERAIASQPVSLDAGIMREGIEMFRQLPQTAEREVVLCTDLHAGNVLAARREPWLAIDPKPFVGDPTYDVLQHMLNCEARLQRDPIGFARRMAAVCGLDPVRLAHWLFARCVQESPTVPSLMGIARRIAPN
jgi:streptomycin 6-kinase